MATGNTKYGDGALENNTVNAAPEFEGIDPAANNNTAVGIAALKNSTEYWNTAVGAYSGYATTTGISNTSVGTNTLLENIDGSYNTALGTATLCFNTSGSNNTAVGSNAMENNTSGSNNTCIGSNANISSNNLNYATAIGADAVVSSDNTIQLGRQGDKVNISGNLDMNGNLTLTKAVGPLISSSIDDLSLQSPAGKSMVFYVGAGASSIIIGPTGILTVPSTIRSINSGAIGISVENQLSNAGGLALRNYNTASDMVFNCLGPTRSIITQIGGVNQVTVTSTATTFAGDISLRTTYTAKTSGFLGYSGTLNADQTGALATGAVWSNIGAGFFLNIGVYFFSILVYLEKTVSGGDVTKIETGISLLNNSFSGGFIATVAGQQTYAGAGTDAIVHNVTFTLPVQINTTLYFLTRATHTLTNLNNTANSYIQFTRVA